MPARVAFPHSTPRKRGRPVAFHRKADGTEVKGLSRQADGRWRISETGETFFESDEYLAIARFEQAMAKRRGRNTVSLPLSPNLGPEEARTAAIEAGATRYEATIRRGKPPEYSVVIGSAVFWAAVRKELADPINVARQTGVEWVGRGADLPIPKPSPTLKSIGDAYAAKPGMTANEVSRSKLFWAEFTKAVAVETVRQINHENIARYEAKIVGSEYSPKSILHRYRKIRTILAYAIKRGIGIEDCRRALDVTAMLEVKDHTPLDPQPISVEQFHAMHIEALKAGDPVFAAMLLTSLNAAMYAGEIAALKWEEIDLKMGEIVTRRPKTGVSRIAILWAETVKALNTLPRTGDYVFNTRVRSYTVYSAMASWRKYREAAELPDALVFSQVRDAAYSIALTVSLDQAKLLAGHRLSGAADHYVRRNPTMVAEACNAIRKAFSPFPKPVKAKD